MSPVCTFGLMLSQPIDWQALPGDRRIEQGIKEGGKKSYN